MHNPALKLTSAVPGAIHNFNQRAKSPVPSPLCALKSVVLRTFSIDYSRHHQTPKICPYCPKLKWYRSYHQPHPVPGSRNRGEGLIPVRTPPGKPPEISYISPCRFVRPLFIHLLLLVLCIVGLVLVKAAGNRSKGRYNSIYLKLMAQRPY